MLKKITCFSHHVQFDVPSAVVGTCTRLIMNFHSRGSKPHRTYQSRRVTPPPLAPMTSGTSKITWVLFDNPVSHCPGWGPDPNWLMIRPSRAHTRVFPDRNYMVWTEVPAQYSLDDDLEMVWSEVILVSKSDHRRIRAHLRLIINGSSAIGSDQKCFWTQLGLIRDHFKGLFFIFCFFTERCWLCHEATIKQRSDQRLI